MLVSHKAPLPAVQETRVPREALPVSPRGTGTRVSDDKEEKGPQHDAVKCGLADGCACACSACFSLTDWCCICTTCPCQGLTLVAKEPRAPPLPPVRYSTVPWSRQQKPRKWCLTCGRGERDCRCRK